jgi:competence protein ComEC
MATMVLPFSGLLSQILFKSAGVLTDELLVIIAEWSRIGLGEVKTAVPAMWEVAMFYVILFSFPFLMKRKKVRYFIAGVLSFILIELAVMFYHSQGTGLLQVTFLDVGRGDAALVEFPGRKTMLIDGGGFMDESFDVGRVVIAPFLYKKGIKKVDYAVLSHPHADHMGGLPYVVENFGVSELWLNNEDSSYFAYKRLMIVARKKGVKKRVCSGGSVPVWIDGVQIEVISPPEGEGVSSPVSYSETNNNSLVIRITFGKISFLFTGDILRERESMLVRSRMPLYSTILKVPHHGAEGSSSEEFVRSVSPEVAVISCRSYGRKKLPSQKVLQRYSQTGTQIYRTDINGAIMIRTNGKTYNVLPCRTEKDAVLPKRRLLTIM